MIRLKVIVEGQTEKTFVRDVLAEHLSPRGIYSFVRQVETGRRRIPDSSAGGRKVFRGGMTTYQKAKRDISRWIKQEGDSPEVYVTTMFDLYALPEDFPGFDRARACATPELRVRALEEAFGADIGFLRFLPYIQLHEFEALVLTGPLQVATWFERTETDRSIRNLVQLVQGTPPEEIDDGEQTCPSRRIIREIPAYAGAKSTAGPQIVQAIGLHRVRNNCPHFDRWVSQLEALAGNRNPGND